MKKRTPTQAMPKDHKAGAPDGVNSQADEAYAGAHQSRAVGSKRKATSGSIDGFFGHGGQSVMGYHGSRQLGDQEVEENGNPNEGAKTE